MTRSGPYKKGNPGCPCCDPCILDRFSGPVEITDANNTTIRSKQHPQSPYPSWLQVEIKVEHGAIGTIFFLWDDSTPGDGIYIEFIPDNPTADAGYVSVYTKDDTKIAGPWYIAGGVSDEWHTLTVCYDPDTDPEQIVITFGPYGDTYLDQSFNVELPVGMTIGRKAGYGTGNGSGSVWFQNYQFDRLWYCGASPYTEECHELGDDWDYYNELPTRVVCHPCQPCPAGYRSTPETAVRTMAGSWAWAGGWARTSSNDARFICWAGQDGRYQKGTFSGWTYAGDEIVFGWSDMIGYNQLYLKFTHDIVGVSGPVYWAGGTYYDETYDRFYFWFIALADSLARSITYSIYSVTNGGAETLVSGPTPLSVGVYPPVSSYMILGDAYVTLHAEQMRHAMFGTGTIVHQIAIAGSGNQCGCSGAVPAVSRKYDAVVAGIVQDSQPFNLSLLNRSPTLRNYMHFSYSSPLDECCYTIPGPIEYLIGSECCYSDWGQVSGTGTYITWFFAHLLIVDGDYYTDLWGYAQADHWGIGKAQIRFYKRLYGRVDARALVGEVLPFESSLNDYVDGSSATFTITSVV